MILNRHNETIGAAVNFTLTTVNVCRFNTFSADGDAHLFMLVELIDFFISFCSSVAYHTLNKTIYKAEVIVWYLVSHTSSYYKTIHLVPKYGRQW